MLLMTCFSGPADGHDRAFPGGMPHGLMDVPRLQVSRVCADGMAFPGGVMPAAAPRQGREG